MKLIKKWKTKWAEASTPTRILIPIHLALCATALTMAILVLCSVVSSFAMFYPLGCMELTSAYLFWRDNHTSARI